MKLRKNLLIAFLAIAGAISFTACNNEDSEPEESLNDSMIELIKETALVESIGEVIDASASEAIAASEDSNLTKSASSTTELSCAVITISPADGSYPRSVTIDFGEQCAAFSGQTRAGSMTVSITDTLRKSGAEFSISFDNFSVDNVLVTGSKSVKNTGTADVPSFTETIDFTIVTLSDIEIHQVKTSTREWTEGLNSRTISDDIFYTTGSAEIISSSGRYYSYNITSPLKTTRLCKNILEGEMEIDWSGSDELITVNFGYGACDWKVNITQGLRIVRRAIFLNN